MSTTHVLDCRRGGLVAQRHNEIRDAIGELCKMAYPQVTKEPVVAESSETGKTLIADLRVRGVWQRQTDACVTDICVTDTDARSYLNRTPSCVLKEKESAKKSKYVAAAEARRASFTPLAFTIDGAAGTEAEMFLETLSEKLAGKWGVSKSVTTQYIRTRLSFAILRATALCVRGSRQKWRGLGLGEDGTALPCILQGPREQDL
eukprot:GHVR01046020.1.p1 GENE.GHVR01046020.1~~GHVR01046020.1.p1  ORF type:complete len:204 (+),score=32.29 GHVR01046020.1:291-902(+)